MRSSFAAWSRSMKFMVLPIFMALERSVTGLLFGHGVFGHEDGHPFGEGFAVCTVRLGKASLSAADEQPAVVFDVVLQFGLVHLQTGPMIALYSASMALATSKAFSSSGMVKSMPLSS